jgi:predicted N-acetyltransferase YhbS
MTITVRQAKAYDATNLCRLMEQAYEDQGGMYPEVYPRSMLVWITEVLLSGYTIVAEKSGRIVGSMALTDFTFPWSPRAYLSVEWFYVNKSFRENGTADALITAAHAFADEGNVGILAGMTSAKDPELKDRLMRMKGYTYMGGTFMRNAHGLEERKEEDEEHVDLHATR